MKRYRKQSGSIEPAPKDGCPSRSRHAAAALLFLLTLFAAPIAGAGDESAAPRDEPPLGPPPGSYKITSKDGRVRIPFEMFRGDIRMQARVNGKNVRMLLDNGFLWDQLLFFGSPAVDALGLEYDGEIDVGGSGEGNPIKSHTASGITITFPGVEFYEQTAVITPYSSGISKMWWGCEGQVSAAFFKHFVVQIDFDAMVITLIEPEAFEYTGKGAQIPMKQLVPSAFGIPATLTLSDGREVSLDLMIDLGDSNPLELSTVGPNKIALPEKAIAASLGYGVQGEFRGHYGRVQSVEIGGYCKRNVIATFSASRGGVSRFHDAMIGMGLLERFNIIFDYPSRRLFIEPNKRFAEPFEYDMSGLSLGTGGEGYLLITRVHPGSAAEEAGLRVGERVTRIDGRAAADYDSWDLRPLMRKAGRQVTLTVVRDGDEVAVPITLRRLL